MNDPQWNVNFIIFIKFQNNGKLLSLRSVFQLRVLNVSLKFFSSILITRKRNINKFITLSFFCSRWCCEEISQPSVVLLFPRLFMVETFLLQLHFHFLGLKILSLEKITVSLTHQHLQPRPQESYTSGNKKKEKTAQILVTSPLLRHWGTGEPYLVTVRVRNNT